MSLRWTYLGWRSRFIRARYHFAEWQYRRIEALLDCLDRLIDRYLALIDRLRGKPAPAPQRREWVKTVGEDIDRTDPLE